MQDRVTLERPMEEFKHTYTVFLSLTHTVYYMYTFTKQEVWRVDVIV